MRRPLLLLLGVLLVVVGGCASPEPVGEPPVRRVLVVSLPGVSWAEVQEADLPNLDAFVEEAAIGDISTRIGRRRASSTDAYLTIGAGTRSIAPSVDVAVALRSEEHTSELQSLMRISYAVFSLKKK